MSICVWDIQNRECLYEQECLEFARQHKTVMYEVCLKKCERLNKNINNTNITEEKKEVDPIIKIEEKKEVKEIKKSTFQFKI